MYRTTVAAELAALEARGAELADKLDDLTVDEAGELRSLDDAQATEAAAMRRELNELESKRSEAAATLANLDAVAERRAAARTAQTGNAATGAAGRGFAAEVRAALDAAGAEARAIATGVAVATNPVIAPDVKAAPHQARRLLDMLTVKPAPTGAFSYMRQTARTNAATTVANGVTKPTSTFTLSRVDGSTDVVAHLSEPVPVRWFDEAPILERFLSDEMEAGLLDANSAKVIAAILADASVQTIPFATSALLTVRKAITALETASVVPAALVFTPADWETLDVAAAEAGVESVRSGGGRQLYGVPVVTDAGLTDTQGLILADDAVEVYATGGVETSFSSAFVREDSDTEGVYVSGFQVNEVIGRSENRIAPAICKPFSARKITLSDA